MKQKTPKQPDSDVFADIPSAIEDIGAGKLVILVDDEDRENEGDLVLAAEFVTPEAINFMAQYGRGLICLAMAPEEIDRLQLPMMTNDNQCKFQTAFTTSIEAAEGVTTGISAYDRAHTIKVAANPNSGANDIVMPGHVFPLRAKKGGVLVRAGQTEGSVDLAQLAKLQPAGVICEIMNEDGRMARLPDLIKFSKKHNIRIVTIKDLITHRLQTESHVEIVAETKLPIKGLGEFKLKLFQSTLDGQLHTALIKGEINTSESILVRVHSRCLTGDVFGSGRCDCGSQLHIALQAIDKQGGVLLYMEQEGRGIGLVNKIKAYALQDQGMDTVEANQHLGFKDDSRDYGIGSQILRKLGVRQMRLLTNNMRKYHGIAGYGLDIVERVAIEVAPTPDNLQYLTTKQEKLGHVLNLLKKEKPK